MRQVELTVRTEGASATVRLDEDTLSRSVAEVVADVVAPAVGPLQATGLRELARHPKASFCLKREDANGEVTEKFVSRRKPLRDVLEQQSTAVTLDVERAADGGTRWHSHNT